MREDDWEALGPMRARRECKGEVRKMKQLEAQQSGKKPSRGAARATHEPLVVQVRPTAKPPPARHVQVSSAPQSTGWGALRVPAG